MSEFLDLTRYKVAFIDFDDTLCVHLNHRTWSDWWMNCFNGSAENYLDPNNCAKDVGMQELLDRLRLIGMNVICLTWSDTSLVVVPKKKWIDASYGAGKVDMVIAVSSIAYKLEFMDQYRDRMGLSASEILVIDDHPDVNNGALSRRYTIITPQEIAVRFGNC